MVYDTAAAVVFEVVVADDGSVVLEGAAVDDDSVVLEFVVGNGEGLETVHCRSARQRSSSWFWSMERSERRHLELESEAGIAVDLSL